MSRAPLAAAGTGRCLFFFIWPRSESPRPLLLHVDDHPTAGGVSSQATNYEAPDGRVAIRTRFSCCRLYGLRAPRESSAP